MKDDKKQQIADLPENISVIIKFKDRIDQMDINSVESLDADVTHVHNLINAVSAKVPINKIGKIKTNPNVEYVEIDQEATILGFPAEVAADQITPWGVLKIRSPEVHQTGNQGEGIKVCIIDTGIDYNHEDLKNNYKGGYNFVKNTTDPMDDHGHGTHVSGTVAALNNQLGVIGVAPGAYIYSLKALDQNGSGSYSNIISAIQWAVDNKMQIISMSLGGSGYSQAFDDACKRANDSGILIIAAAGNSNGDGSKDTVSYPGKFDSVVAVAATDSNDARASFSSAGPAVEVAAPGVNVPSTVPKSGNLGDPSGYKNLNGTSMATPHISGTAALVMKAHPNISNKQVREILQKATIDLGNQGRDVFFGYGRIDAKAAVDSQEPPPPPPQKRYTCTGSPNYECIEDPNGQFTSLDECLAKCKETPPPEKRYKCTGAPNYQCIEDPNGPYTSLDECIAKCKETPPPTPGKRYSCKCQRDEQGKIISRECVEDSDGCYDSLEACKAACEKESPEPPQPPQRRYKCEIIYDRRGNPLTAICIPDVNGEYTSLRECADVCRVRRSDIKGAKEKY